MAATRRRTRIIPIVALTASVLTASFSAADAVYLKDGFTLHGKVRREAELITDPLTGQMIPIIKGSNFFIVDDHVRWVIFDHRNVENADPNVDIRRDFLMFTNPHAAGYMPLPNQARVLGESPFNDKWERVVRLKNDLGEYRLRQRITQLNGYYARLEAVQYRWTSYYLTQELGLETVQKLIDSHPDLSEKKGAAPDIEKRMKRFRLLLQANWLTAAEEELNRTLRDLPKEKERIERSRTILRQAQIQALCDEAKRAQKAGAYSAARQILTRLPITELDSRQASELRPARTKLEKADQQIRECRKLIRALCDRLGGPPAPLFAEALAAIDDALNPDTVDRLESFITLANQHENAVKAGKEPSDCIENVLALAVTGFVLGNAAAEPKVASAERLWQAREFAVNYLRSPDPSTRKHALETYEAGRPLAYDEFAQLVQLLPPPDPAELPTGSAPTVEERTTNVPWGRGRPVPYSLLVPPEYTHNRAWPVLIVIPSGGGERTTDALTRWALQAQENGYILASPQWAEGIESYGYTSEEHLPVLELIRDLRRHYNVDSDRIFLAGYSDGGTIATDIGLAHPSLFAGVVTMNARPRWSASMWYWHNAQYLPFYIVTGELAGDTGSKNRRVFENWMNRGYSSLMTIYKGRTSEFFLQELPFAFDWMNRKRRAIGFPELGRMPNAGSQGEEFQTARAGDNRFYWLEVLAHYDRYLTTYMGTGERAYTPAALQATIRDANTIALNARGIRTLRVWLGQAFDPQAGWRPMVDFSRPITFMLNRQPPKVQKVMPSLGVMLEDLFDRGDRQRLFWAYVDFDKIP